MIASDLQRQRAEQEPTATPVAGEVETRPGPASGPSDAGDDNGAAEAGQRVTEQMTW